MDRFAKQRSLFLLSCVFLFGGSQMPSQQIATAEDVTIWPSARPGPGATGAISTALPESMEVLWEQKTPEAIETTLVCDTERLYYTDVMGSVGALEMSGGKPVWRRDFDTGFSAPAALYCARRVSGLDADQPWLLPILPASSREQKRVPPEGSVLVVGDVEGGVYGLNPADGQTLWKSETEGEINAAASFFVWNDSQEENTDTQIRLLQTSQDGSLYCLNAHTGELIWKYETGDQVRCGASIADGKTYLGGCDGGLHVVDLETGKAARDPLPLGGPTGSTPAVDRKRIYAPIMDGILHSFDTDSGEEVWQYEDRDTLQDYRSDVAVNDKFLVVSSRSKSIDALNRKTGERLWRVSLRRRADASPLIAGDDVWIAGSDGRLLRLSLLDGSQKWEFETRGAFFAAPSIVGDRLLIADDEGVIRCFGSK